MKNKIDLLRQLISIAHFLSFLIFFSGEYSYGQEVLTEDYRSIQTISFMGGIVGVGVGGEMRVDIPIKGFILNGSIGYKGSSVRDSLFTYRSMSYNRIITSDCKGMIFNLGFGIRIHRADTTEQIFVASSTTYSEDAFHYYITSYGRSYYFPKLITTYLMFEVSSLPTGQFIEVFSGFNEKKNLLVPGNNFYISPGIRRFTEINNIRGGGLVKETFIHDFGLIMSTDFRQAGLCVKSLYIKGHFSMSYGLSLMRRFDKPDVVDDPFDGDGMYKWAVPFNITVGFNLNRMNRTFLD